MLTVNIRCSYTVTAYIFLSFRFLHVSCLEILYSDSFSNSLVVSISHSTSSAFSLQGRNIRFLRTAFNTTGEAFAAGDHQGNIFVFDLGKNR